MNFALLTPILRIINSSENLLTLVNVAEEDKMVDKNTTESVFD